MIGHDQIVLTVNDYCSHTIAIIQRHITNIKRNIAHYLILLKKKTDPQ